MCDISDEEFDRIYLPVFKLCHIYVKLLSNSKFDTKDFINFLFKYHPYI